MDELKAKIRDKSPVLDKKKSCVIKTMHLLTQLKKIFLNDLCLII